MWNEIYIHRDPCKLLSHWLNKLIGEIQGFDVSKNSNIYRPLSNLFSKAYWGIHHMTT